MAFKRVPGEMLTAGRDRVRSDIDDGAVLGDPF